MCRRAHRGISMHEGRGLALPAALLLLGMLGLLLAAAQRAALLEWRSAAMRESQVQAREDALAALSAARHWLLARGALQAVQDCEAAPRPAAPRLCRQALRDAARPPWDQGVHGGIDGCVHECGFHIQVLDDPRDAAAAPASQGQALRLSAYARGPATTVLQLDLWLQRRDDAPPRLLRRASRVLR